MLCEFILILHIMTLKLMKQYKEIIWNIETDNLVSYLRAICIVCVYKTRPSLKHVCEAKMFNFCPCYNNSFNNKTMYLQDTKAKEPSLPYYFK